MIQLKFSSHYFMTLEPGVICQAICEAEVCMLRGLKSLGIRALTYESIYH